jgi:hypothetical protein
VAVAAVEKLAVIGLNVWGVAEVASWIGAHFSGPGAAAADVPLGTRDYYAELAARWGEAGQVGLEPARAQFFGPVVARAIQLIRDPSSTHAELGLAVAELAAVYDKWTAEQGGPIGTIIGGQAPPTAPAGALAGMRDPLGSTVVAAAGRGLLVGVGFAALLGLLWWRYGD